MLIKTWIRDFGFNGLKFILTSIALFCFSNSYAQSPVASFTTIDSIGCAPFSITFNNTSANANVFYWDFGNGNTSSLPNPNTIYINSGTYTVTLIAGNSTSGLSDTLVATNYFNIVPDPISSFTVNQTSGCLTGNSFNFTNNSINATTYTWDFGDGNFSTLTNPSHTYASPGTYTIKLIAKNNFGCENISIQNNYITVHPTPNAFHSASFTSSCDSTDIFSFTSNDPNTASWFWEFGDGNTSTAQNPAHTYGISGNFNVSLTVVDINGCTKKRTKNNYINIGSSLVPSFSLSDSGGCAPIKCYF